MENINKIFENSKIRLLVLLCVSLLVIAPTYFLGIYKGPDISQHFQFADTFERAILSGDFYPSWSAYENLGYGSLGLRFYPPLFSFLLACIHIITGSWHIATCLTFLIFSFIGSLGIYLAAKEFLAPNQAIWAGIIFALMPYHLNQIYNISVYAEFAGCSVLSFCFLFATRVCRKGKLIDVIGLSISYAVLILTHLPSAVIGSICLLIHGLLMLPKNKAWSTLVKLSAGSLLGLAASSVYWSRMVPERSWMRLTQFRNDIVFDYKQNFLLTSEWFDSRQYWFLNIVLLVTLFMVLMAFWGLYKRDELKIFKDLRGVIVLFLVSVLMTTFISKPIWIILPFIQEVQFPFRWLTITVVSGSIIASAAINPIYELAMSSLRLKKAINSMLAVLIIGMIIVFSLTWISVSNNYLPTNNFDEWVNNTTSSMGFEFFWTTKTKEEAFNIREKVIAGERTAEITSWKPEERIFTVSPGNATDARIATLFYPHWYATINDQPTELKIADDGTILVSLPSEKATVKIWFEEPFRVKLATYVSAATWIILVLISLLMLAQKQFNVINTD
jgi:uncharacterized membrane protein